MLKSLRISNAVKHHGRTFEFKAGLNVIMGENEAGKSLILEMIAFALFGSKALRLPVSKYSSKLSTELTLTIQDMDYLIQRSINNATLMYTNGVIVAKGTKAVNAQIVSSLGYGYEVYNVSNYSAQESVQHLATLKPAERKNLIENVIGLTAVEKVLAQHKSLLNEHRRALNVVESYPPEPLLEVDESLETEDSEVLKREHQQFVNDISFQRQAKLTIEQVEKTRPKVVEKPDPLKYNYPQGFVSNYYHTRASITNKLNNSRKRLEQILPSITTDQIDSDELEQQWQLHDASKLKGSLIAQGHVICEACDHVNYFAKDKLTGLDDIPVGVPKPLLARDYYQWQKELKQKQEALTQEISDLEKELAEHCKDMPSDAELNTEVNLVDAHIVYENYLTKVEQFNKAMGNLPKYNPEILQAAIEKEAELNKRIIIKETILDQLAINGVRVKAIEAYEKSLREIKVELESEALKVKVLSQVLGNVKSHLLPSINATASTWLNRMSDGKHQKVELTETMEILVNDELIEALSVSGRALGHLSLRMALGQVLTNSVFPVFIADEVDSSMRNNRAQLVLDNLLNMLNQSVKQIIMITHQSLERIDHVIEV